MLSVAVFVPALAGLVLLAVRRVPPRVALRAWVAVSGFEVALVTGMWIAHRPGAGFAYQQDLPWIPTVGVRYHVGVDGLSMPLVALTVLLFFCCAVYSLREARRPRAYAALFLFLETVSIGTFAALDLIVFFVFFDLSIVAMYFVIAGWGHRGARAAALKFFLYTFLGSLALLLGFIGLYLAATPRTFDIPALVRQAPLDGRPVAAGLVLLALVVGLAIKTPSVPFHTWLPPAHGEAPAAGSAILAGVLLKLGTYGFVRIAMPMLPEAWRRYAMVIVILGVLSVVYGALVALAQTDFKRMVAYTSVNHMGYILLALGAAGLTTGEASLRTLATTGALTQMVSHGLITGALFLIAGLLYDRGGTYDMRSYGGLAARAPLLAGVTATAAFASLGLPGFSGFIAEFQIFAGSLGLTTVPTAIALLGILLTAALFLWALHRVFLGPAGPAVARMSDVRGAPAAAIVVLLVMTVVIGLAPRFLLDIIEPAARELVGLVSR